MWVSTRNGQRHVANLLSGFVFSVAATSGSHFVFPLYVRSRLLGVRYVSCCKQTRSALRTPEVDTEGEWGLCAECDPAAQVVLPPSARTGGACLGQSWRGWGRVSSTPGCFFPRTLFPRPDLGPPQTGGWRGEKRGAVGVVTGTAPERGRGADARAERWHRRPAGLCCGRPGRRQGPCARLPWRCPCPWCRLLFDRKYCLGGYKQSTMSV